MLNKCSFLYIKGQLLHAKRVDVVWDEYTPNNEEQRGKNEEKASVEGSNHQPSCQATGMNFFECTLCNVLRCVHAKASA